MSVSVKNGTVSDLKSLLNIHNHLLHCIDEAAIANENGLHPKHRLMSYHRFFVDRVGVGDLVLDVGCGVGAVAHSLAQHGAIVTGVDFNNDQLAKARKRYQHPNCTFIHGDVTKILPDARFDVIVLSNVLEHIEKRTEILTILKNKFSPKKMLLRVPMIDRDWLVPLKKEMGLRYFSDDTHFTEYTWLSFKEEVEKAGLQIIEHQINWGELWAHLTPANDN